MKLGKYEKMSIEEYYKRKKIDYEPPNKTEFFKKGWIHVVPKTIDVLNKLDELGKCEDKHPNE